MKPLLRSVSAVLSVAGWSLLLSAGLAALCGAQTGGSSAPLPVRPTAGPTVSDGPMSVVPNAGIQSATLPSTAPASAVPPSPAPASATLPSVPQLPEAKAPEKRVASAKDKKGKPAEVPVEDPNASEKPYVIGSLDVLEIKVWNDAKLSGLYEVRPDGVISMPLIGEMRGDGLTAMELTQVIKAKLSATVLEDPEVNIQVVKINSKRFYILGGCLRQGEFPLVGTMTMLDAFANCGGFKDFANLKKIHLLRDGKLLPFNYKDAIQGKHLELNFRLQNGDRIIVPE